MYNQSMIQETYISVDVETAGPVPCEYALLSLGACLAADPAVTFYRELKPDRPAARPDALDISGLSMQALAQTGCDPQCAMRDFAEWVESVTPAGHRPVFVAFNAPFDWMFVADYFHRYLGRNPFGHSALDIKAYYMGLTGVLWSETSLQHVARRLQSGTELKHNALSDAQDQARIFQEIFRRPQIAAV